VDGGDGRRRAGLLGDPSRVITDKAIFGFDPTTKQMTLLSIHPNTTLEEVLQNMGFAPRVPEHVPFTEPPTAEQLRLIREQIDPGGMYLG
jgi:glutaconate CoA-transferase subunit B